MHELLKAILALGLNEWVLVVAIPAAARRNVGSTALVQVPLPKSAVLNTHVLNAWVPLQVDTIDFSKFFALLLVSVEIGLGRSGGGCRGRVFPFALVVPIFAFGGGSPPA